MSLVILSVVLVLIAVRKIGRFRLQIWQIMLGGAVLCIACGTISWSNAVAAVNLDVMLFLFGVFVIGRALEVSGYLSYLSFRFFRPAQSPDQVLILILLVMGIASALLMNDTLAIVGTPVVLQMARKYGVDARIFLIALAFAVTTGSVASPIGNPQNLLIAIDGGFDNPFVSFGVRLFVPTLLNLVLTYLVLKVFYRGALKASIPNHWEEMELDPSLVKISRLSLGVLVVLIGYKIISVSLGMRLHVDLTTIAVLSALPILLFSSRRLEIVKSIDWHTLVFFAAMFVVMKSVWDAGVFQSLIESSRIPLDSPGAILGVSIGLSQFISNVPLVALYLPLLTHIGASTNEMILLAAGSTIAGNLSIVGAASNIIIIQNAEKRTGDTLGFWEFIKIGVPLTVLHAFVYWLFL